MSESISLKFNHSEDHLLENESYFFCSSPSLLNSMFNELIPSATESKTYVEDFKGDKREILFSDFSYIIKNEFHQINRVFVEKVLAGISKKYEFRLPHTKTLNTNTKFKIVKPLEVEYPLINKHYLSIKGS